MFAPFSPRDRARARDRSLFEPIVAPEDLAVRRRQARRAERRRRVDRPAFGELASSEKDQ
jgi:hypothetical protein